MSQVAAYAISDTGLSLATDPACRASRSGVGQRTVPDVRTLTLLYNERRNQLGSHGRPLSHRAAAVMAGNDGMYETFRLIANGKHSGRISEEVVAAFVALGIGEREVRRAAGHQMEVVPGPFALPDRANRLTLPQREVVVSVVDAILTAAERADTRPALRAVARAGTDTAAARREATEKARKARGK